MTPLDKVYDAFLGKILEDEWGNWTMDEVVADLRVLLDAAISWFKFPRVDLSIEDDHFVGDLSNSEIQILATYMKCEWLNRTIMTWENVKTLYEERDISQANLIDKLNEKLTQEKTNGKNLESIYYRSIKGKPFGYSRLAGDS